MLAVALSESIMSSTQFQMRYNRLKKGRENVNDDALPSGQSTSSPDENIKAVKKMFLYNHRITIIEVPDYVGLTFASCQAIFTNVLLNEGQRRLFQN